MVLRYFSMFSGIGGFEYGMEQSNVDFECVGFCEVDKYATSIYTRHFPNHRNYGDATKIKTEELDDFEFLVGGFPCQAFSIGGKRKGFNEARGTLFFEIARILKDKTPRYFLLENVAGLLSHEGGRTFQKILEVCDELGYDVSWAIYNSKDYGVPQNRERIFLKGYFRKECSEEVLYIQKQNKKVNGKLIQVNNFKKTSAGGRVYSIGGFFPCLRVSFNEQIIEDGIIRRLTPKEFERLQGFLDNWTKYGKDGELISDTQRYKCLGNAVTTTVVTAIVNQMFEGVEMNE